MRMTTVQYDAAEVARHFLALYHGIDFQGEILDLGIGKFQFSRRKKALREFKALTIALWGLALQKSFPNDAAEFFKTFRERAPDLVAGGKDSALLQNRLNIYIELLAPQKDTDFSPVAGYLAEVLALDAEDMRRMSMKLSLIMRNLYKLIFDKLV